jgi:hypothetical protein
MLYFLIFHLIGRVTSSPQELAIKPQLFHFFHMHYAVFGTGDDAPGRPPAPLLDNERNFYISAI